MTDVSTLHHQGTRITLAIRAYSTPLYLAMKELEQRRRAEGGRGGYGCGKRLAKALGIQYQSLANLMTLKKGAGPKFLYLHWDHIQKVLMELTGRLWEPEDVFPALTAGARKKLAAEQAVHGILPSATLEELAAAGAIPALPPSPEEAVSQAELKKNVDRALRSLTPREAQVLRRHFGLNADETEETMGEIGESLDVQRSRISQIEHVALRKLRHPSRAKLLKSFL
jgi:RNA polymerase sigma factor (sigma-70 family)